MKKHKSKNYVNIIKTYNLYNVQKLSFFTLVLKVDMC